MKEPEDGSVKREHGKSINERFCIASEQLLPTERLVRFVAGPGNVLVPDLRQRLGGRGVWVSANRSALEKVRKGKAFSRRLKRPIQVSETLADDVETLLRRHLIQGLSLARKAGLAVSGWQQVETMVRQNKAGLLVQGRDGAANGQQKMLQLAHQYGLPLVSALTIDELSIAFGGKNVVNVALGASRMAEIWLVKALNCEHFNEVAEDAR